MIIQLLLFYVFKNAILMTLWRQKIAILIRMQFLNDIIKSRHGFKTAQNNRQEHYHFTSQTTKHLH